MKRIIIQTLSGATPDKIDSLIIPDDMDVEQEKKLLLVKYPPNKRTESFSDWLISRGATKDDKIIICYE